MKLKTLRHWVAYSVSMCQILLSCSVFLSIPVYSQTLDTEPPEVGLDGVSEALKGDSQVFTVSATDDSEISDLTVFIRQGTTGEFESAQMMRIGNTDLFTYTLRAEFIDLNTDVIQYYFDARDVAGNRTLQGFSFDPLERTLIKGDTTLAESSPPSSSQSDSSDSVLGSLSTTQKVVYGAVALVVVGALIAAASSGGGSGGSGGNPGDEFTPVTITSDPLVPGL